MKEEQQRLSKALAAAVAVHIVFAAIVGIFGYRFVTRPPQILEVTLAGGGGGAPEEVVEEQQEETVVRSIEDIIDKRLKPETKKVVTRKPVKKSAQASNNPAPANPNANASGEGSGSGEGTGTGEGSGSGEGTGSGEGSGRGEHVTPPRVVYSVQPKYPSAARSQGVEGVTAVKMLVNASGKVEEAFVVQSSGNAALDEAAVAAVYKWRFSPAKDEFGQKAPCYVTQGIRFDLRR